MRIKLLLTALLCVALGACGEQAEYHTTSGASGKFRDLHGRWLLINYWAAWCKPCLAELPELNRFNREFAGKAAVFGVNFDGVTGEQLQQQVAKLGIEIPVLNEDPAAQLGFKRPEVLPSTYVFGPDGKLRQVLQGEQTFDSLAAAIRHSDDKP